MEHLLTWKTTEHPHVERGSDWYWALGVSAVSLALISILFGNLLFAILIVLAAFVLGMQALKKHPVVEISLQEKGLLVDDTLYPYEEMFCFWVKEGDNPMLMIDTPRFMTPDLVIALEDIDPESVRAFLSERVPETEMRESFFYRIMEFVGF